MKTRTSEAEYFNESGAILPLGVAIAGAATGKAAIADELRCEKRICSIPGSKSSDNTASALIAMRMFGILLALRHLIACAVIIAFGLLGRAELSLEVAAVLLRPTPIRLKKKQSENGVRRVYTKSTSAIPLSRRLFSFQSNKNRKKAQ